MKSKLLLIAAVALAGLGYLAVRGFGSGDAAPDPNAHHSQPGLPVYAAEVTQQPMPQQIDTVARVQPMATVAVQPRIEGVIASVNVQEGQEVKAGDLLMTLDDRALQAALRQAQANLAKDRAQLENAKRNVNRLIPLAAKNFTSAQTLDQAKTDVAAFEATVAADEAQVQADQVELSYTVIKAPISGRIGSINSKLGNLVRQADTTPLMTINQLRPIYVSFSVQQNYLDDIQAAMQAGPVHVAAIFPDAKQLPSIVGETPPAQQGDVAFIDNTIDSASNTLTVKAKFDNIDERLWPGQYVNIIMTLKTDPKAIVVPTDALQISQQGSYVWIVKPDMTVEMRPVTVAQRIENKAVISKGVSPGEKVVTEGQMRLENGAKVSVEQRKAEQTTTSVEAMQ
ncbi:MAG: efflux RND transporter periplasmic adaptor subunit [Rhodospirillaceae bacterium]|nr:MAG: efflux RND transporter periplasmic adaptor subunit [Rhodospirillaceae bacterium]